MHLKTDETTRKATKVRESFGKSRKEVKEVKKLKKLKS
jgi:hypothetical protein